MLAAAGKGNGAVARDPKCLGLGRIHGLVGPNHAELAGCPTEVGEVPGQLFGHLAAWRIKQGNLDGLVERGHQLLGRRAGARGTEKGKVGLDVSLRCDVGDGEAKHQREGHAQPGKHGGAHAAGVDEGRSGHPGQGEFHQQRGQGAGKQDGRPEHGDGAIQLRHAHVEGAAAEQGGQGRA